MLARLSLRARIVLFFALLGIGALAILAGSLGLGYRRAGDPSALPGFVSAGVVAGFGIAALVAGIWLLFDENVAKPIERIAADLRSRAHADVAGAIDPDTARYLGDLAPAAAAVSRKIGDQNLRAAEQIATETARLVAEREHLTSLLSQIPVAVLMVSPDHRLVLYDGQAAQALEPVGPLALGRPVSDYLEPGQIERAFGDMEAEGRRNTDVSLSTRDGTMVFEAHIRRLGDGAGYMLTFPTAPDSGAQRPIVFDFDLFARPAPAAVRDTPLGELTYVVFDTETTGLLPDRDEVVQIGAVRIVNGRLVGGERFDMLVNPGRPIPATSTRVHGISDDMVAGAPTMAEAGARFRKFAQGAVLVAHNAPFDMAFLQRDAEAAGTRMDHPVMDTVLLSAVLFGGSAEHTLDAIADRLGVEIPEVLRHSALGDAEATAAVLLKMLPMLEARGLRTFGEVLTAMRGHTRILPDLNHDDAPA